MNCTGTWCTNKIFFEVAPSRCLLTSSYYSKPYWQNRSSTRCIRFISVYILLHIPPSEVHIYIVPSIKLEDQQKFVLQLTKMCVSNKAICPLDFWWHMSSGWLKSARDTPFVLNIHRFHLVKDIAWAFSIFNK